MALPTKVNIGTAPGNGTGDPARTAFDKLNKRDEYLDSTKAGKDELTALQIELDNKETPEGAQAKADQAESNANAYTDSLAQGFKWKNPVDVATTENITLSGEQTIDGVLTAASRVLVKDQTNAAENGIYLSGVTWTRTTDADTASELVKATTTVSQGTQAGKIFTCNSDPATLGTSEVNFVSPYTATNHNSTVGLQGGQAGQYYHLTLAQVEKLNGLEAGATADMTANEIAVLYEGLANTNKFTDTLKSKLEGIPSSIEPAFTKNSAFNKNFGKVAGTVAEGNDSRILNGQTAYEYGDHAEAGYALDSEVVKSISVNGGTPVVPDENGNTDLTVEADVNKSYVDAADAALQSQITALEASQGGSTTELISFASGWEPGTLNANPSATWKEDGILDSFSGSRTAFPDANDPMYAIWYIDLTTGTVEIKYGEPSVTPELPTVDDPINHIDTGIFFHLAAGATTPTDVAGETIYAEGAVGEWAVSGTGTIITNDTNPRSGTYNILATLTAGQYIEFTAPSALTSGELAYRLQNIVGGSHHIIFIGTLAKNGRSGSWTLGSPGNYSDSSTAYQSQSLVFPSELSSITSFRIVSGVDGLNIRLDDMYVISGGGSVVGGYATKEELAAVEADVADHETRIATLEAGGGGGGTGTVNSVTLNGTTYEPDETGDVDLGATPTTEELSITWNEATDDNIFTVEDATKVLRVFVQGKRLNKGTEWEETDATHITILNTLRHGVNIIIEYGSEFSASEAVYSIDTPGSIIAFDDSRTYGNTIPISGAISYDFTGAKFMCPVFLMHNDSVELSLPSGSVIAQGMYKLNEINYIQLVYLSIDKVLVYFNNLS